MKYIRNLSRLLVGVVFVFSGFVKAIDPLGSTYKFIDYFNAFGIGSLEVFALPLAVILSTTELVLGISLLLGYRMKISSWVVLIFMSFFTLLTFILALTDPVKDCGCFGDALILTNWQTFWKNVVIMVFVIILFRYRLKYEPIRSFLVEWTVLLGFFIAGVVLSVYCYRFLPILDFRPYKIGTYIPDAMIIPEGAPKSEFETLLYYKNRETGKEKEFTMENFPRDTTMWDFVDAVTNQISEGYEPPIHDFNIIAPNGGEITDDIIYNEGYTFLLISYDALEANSAALIKANLFFRYAQMHKNVQFFAVSSSLREELDSLRLNNNLEYDFCQADEITLKTIVRSNPGLVLLKNGVIINKWHYNEYTKDNFRSRLYPDMEHFPFCEGCDLKQIFSLPAGSSSDQFETVLYYRNLLKDSVYSFSIEDFPSNSENWEFENSETKKTVEGYRLPVTGMRIGSVAGKDVTSDALFNEEYSLLFFLRDPFMLDESAFRTMNKFGGMAMDYLDEFVNIYAVTGLDAEESNRFTMENISPFEFFSTEPEFIEPLAGDSIFAVLLKNGKVLFSYSGEHLPEPEILGDLASTGLDSPDIKFLPAILGDFAVGRGRYIVMLFIAGFLVVSMGIGLYFNGKKPDA